MGGGLETRLPQDVVRSRTRYSGLTRLYQTRGGTDGRHEVFPYCLVVGVSFCMGT